MAGVAAVTAPVLARVLPVLEGSALEIPPVFPIEDFVYPCQFVLRVFDQAQGLVLERRIDPSQVFLHADGSPMAIGHVPHGTVIQQLAISPTEFAELVSVAGSELSPPLPS